MDIIRKFGFDDSHEFMPILEKLVMDTIREDPEQRAGIEYLLLDDKDKRIYDIKKRINPNLTHDQLMLIVGIIKQ